MSKTVLDLRGRKVAVAEGGRGDPLIYLHGFADVHAVAGDFQDFHLRLCEAARVVAPALPTKSGIILGLGETRDELVATMRDLRGVDVEILTLGQYLRPSAQHLPVEKYYHPDEFAELAVVGRELGFRHVESGPLVRSSYHAKRQSDLADASDD